MHRRDFFKTLLSTSLLTPWLISADRTASPLQLHLISDRPDIDSPIILDELRKRGLFTGRTFEILDGHPHARALSRALSRRGWTGALRPGSEDLILSFRSINPAVAPSFTAVRGGSIQDFRSRRLLQFWKEMNGRPVLSSGLTIMTLNPGPKTPRPGRSVAVYRNGRLEARLLLHNEGRTSFPAAGGSIVVAVENGRARVESSPCRHRICSGTPPVSTAGERIICAPSHFFLEVEGFGGLDTVIG